MTVTITLTPTTLDQYKALRDLDLSAFVDPQYILTESTTGEQVNENDAQPEKRGPGRPRKAPPAAATAQPAPEAPAAPATPPAAPPAAPVAAPATPPPTVETAGEPASAQRQAISDAMKNYMKKGTHQSLRDIVRKYSESGSLSGVADNQLPALLADVETALLML